MPFDTEEATKKICEGGKIAYLIHEDYVSTAPCKIVKIPVPIMTGWYGFSL